MKSGAAVLDARVGFQGDRRRFMSRRAHRAYDVQFIRINARYFTLQYCYYRLPGGQVACRAKDALIGQTSETGFVGFRAKRT